MYVEYVMDMTSHFEFPAVHIDPATATIEDIAYALTLGRHDLAHYCRIIQEIEKIMEEKSATETKSL